jgi:hypothetical protein
MLEDPIVEEARKVRNAHAKKFNYNLEAIAADLKAQQSLGERKLVVFAPRKPQVVAIYPRIEPVVAEQPGKYKA